jgi:hypothetical protein
MNLLEPTVEYSFDIYEDTIYKIDERDFKNVLAELMEYINDPYNKEESIMNIIIDYCDDKNISVDAISDVIKSNRKLKNLLKEDCIDKHILVER